MLLMEGNSILTLQRALTLMLQETPARKSLRQSGLKSLQQTRYHTPATQPRINPNRLAHAQNELVQRINFNEESREGEESNKLKGMIDFSENSLAVGSIIRIAALG